MPTAANDNRPASFDAALMKWMPFLYRLARRLEPNRQEHEDVVQETVQNALSRWASYREENNFPGWLKFQFRSTLQARRKKRAPITEPIDNHFTAVLPTQEIATELSQVANRLQGRGGAAVLRIATGQDLAEIAADFGMSRERVRVIANIERDRLRKSLNTVRMAA